MSRTKDAIAGVRCPACGNDGSQGQGLRYVEDIQCWRQVLGPTTSALQIEAQYQIDDGYDDGTNPRFECMGDQGPKGLCAHTWPVPEWLVPLIEWR